MLEKLKEIEEKFIGIESELAKPEVVSDKEKFRALMKEHKTLLPIVEKYREYCAEKKNGEEALFSWIVSDFGLNDGVEAGLVKTPRVIVRDDGNF